MCELSIQVFAIISNCRQKKHEIIIKKNNLYFFTWRLDKIDLSNFKAEPKEYYKVFSRSPRFCTETVGLQHLTSSRRKPAVPYSRTSYDISKASDWSRWPSRTIRSLRYIGTVSQG